MNWLRVWAWRIAGGIGAALAVLAWYYRQLAGRRETERDTAQRERDTVTQVRERERSTAKAQETQRQENAEHERTQDRSRRPNLYGDSRMRDD